MSTGNSTRQSVAQSILPEGMIRAVGAAIIFSLPMLMTMEMWSLGLYLDRWRILLLLAVGFPLLVLLSRKIGFESTSSWVQDVRDVTIAFGIGIATSAAILTLLAIFERPPTLSSFSGQLALQTVPAALGALLGRTQFGQKDDIEKEEDSFGGELLVMAAGALFLSLNVAPTEEMRLISFRMTSWHALVLIPVSLAIMHAFVFAASFSGGSEISPHEKWWSAFLRFTVTGYVVALLISLIVLWVLGQVDGMDLQRVLRVTVVLGFPAAIGAAAARLIL